MYISTEYKIKTKIYREKYYLIIKNAKLANRNITDETYYEKHHIFPKSIFPQWKTKKSNIVLLTREEHLQAHKLLLEIFPCKEMSYAYSFMTKLIDKTNNNIIKEFWNDPLYRKKVTDSNNKYWNNQENLDKHSKHLKDILAKIYNLHPERRYNCAKATKQPVRNIETGIEFENMAEAGKWANIKSYCHIGEVCRHERNYAGKTPDGRKATWEYIELSKRSQLHLNLDNCNLKD